MTTLLLWAWLSGVAHADMAPVGPAPRGEVPEDLAAPSDPGAPPAWALPAGVAVLGALMLGGLVVVRTR